MDREAKEEYFVVIQAKDMGGHMGGLSGTTTVTITLSDVNDNPPKFAQSKCGLSWLGVHHIPLQHLSGHWGYLLERPCL